MGLFRISIYSIIFGVYAYTLVYDVRFLPRIGIEWWLQKLVMLSVLNLVLQTFYSGLCLICAIFDWTTESKEPTCKSHKHVLPSYWRNTRTHNICDFTYFTSAFPVGMATCILYWAIYLINPDAVMPAWVAKMLPRWYNLVIHCAPVGFLLIDTLLTCHHAPSRGKASAVVLSLFAFYTLLILTIKHLNGYWLYPIFDLLTLQYQIALVVIGGVLFWFLYLIGDGLNTALWGRASHATPSVKSKKN